MKEEFLHFLWKYGLYHQESLRTTDGYKIEVLYPGDYNRDSGPDFFNARIRYRDIEWAGNVEVHAKASHFNLHGHNRDHAYDNVILHVVAVNDCQVYSASGTAITTVEIAFDSFIYQKYLNLVNNPCSIACQEEISSVSNFYVRHWLNVLVVERLEEKYRMVAKMFEETGNDWEEVLYRMISRYFGFRVNAEPFEMLASALPFRIIRKHADNRLQVEALLFGTAGLLTEGLFRDAISDEYYRELLREYYILRTKYSLKLLHGWIWKFNKLRPVNFPTIRLSQLAGMLCVAGGLFSRVLETKEIHELRNLFSVSASKYWDTHYIFGKVSKEEKKNTGELATGIIIINAVVPVLFTYGKIKDKIEYCSRSLDFLENSSPEDNRIIREWKAAGLIANSAFDSQGLLQLRTAYCNKRKCIHCRIGNKLILNGIVLKNEDELMLEP